MTYLNNSLIFNHNKINIMETTIQKIKNQMVILESDYDKFIKGNNSAGTRVRKTSQDIKNLFQQLRGEVLTQRKTDNV